MKYKKTNPVAVAMRKRYPRSQQMNSKKRLKDYKNSWEKDAEDDIDSGVREDEKESAYNPALDPDYLWQLPQE